jgi:phosphoribosyl-ATP pyrophosphohydrolase
METNDILTRLMAVIEQRKTNPPEKSYTVELFRGGVDAIGAKVREEAEEVIEAAAQAAQGNRPPLVHEAADLIFHLLVMLGYCGVSLGEVEAELARRFGISGLEEKARRANPR